MSPPDRPKGEHSSAQTRRASRRWLPVVTAVLLVAALLFALAMVLQQGLLQLSLPPVSVVIDGDEVFSGVDLNTLPRGQLAGLVGGVTLALLIIAALVPLTLLAVAALVLMILLLAVGLPLLALGAVFMLLLWPLLLLVLVLWWLIRPGKAERSATIGE